MFTERQPGIVASDEGFEVADLGVRYITYREGDHLLKFGKDIGMNRSTYYLRDMPRWQPPFEEEFIPPAKAAQIRTRVIRAMEFRGHPFLTDMNELK